MSNPIEITKRNIAIILLSAAVVLLAACFYCEISKNGRLTDEIKTLKENTIPKTQLDDTFFILITEVMPQYEEKVIPYKMDFYQISTGTKPFTSIILYKEVTKNGYTPYQIGDKFQLIKVQ